ncbi:hypothetical protein ACOME3_007515 [Neoechinorhynchus agilis]
MKNIQVEQPQQLGGINKDTVDALYSPHHYLHFEAARVSVLATEHFFDVLREEIGDVNFVKLFMVIDEDELETYKTDSLTEPLTSTDTDSKDQCTVTIRKRIGEETIDEIEETSCRKDKEMLSQILSETADLTLKSLQNSIIASEDTPRSAVAALVASSSKLLSGPVKIDTLNRPTTSRVVGAVGSLVQNLHMFTQDTFKQLVSMVDGRDMPSEHEGTGAIEDDIRDVLQIHDLSEIEHAEF